MLLLLTFGCGLGTVDVAIDAPACSDWVFGEDFGDPVVTVDYSETQINVVDHQVLEEARQHPEEFRDLVVRIGGYTDYFTRLTPEMQDEIILRTEFGDA